MDEPPLFGLIGETPLVEVRRANPHRDRGVRVFAKLEMRNPGGSVKDRAARGILRAAIAKDELAHGRTLVDATSGNTGIALAMLCAALGAPCRLFVPANASAERLAIMRAHGAEVTLTDPLEGQDGAIDAVRALVRDEPSRWYHADQYANPANPAEHERTTAAEIWRDTKGAITHFVAALGTSGTAMGTTRGLKAHARGIVCASVEPKSPMHGLEGMKHMASSHVPPIYRPEALDERLVVETEEARSLVRRLAREEGLFVGASSGAALAGALQLAAEAPRGSVVVTIFPDGGERYLSTRLWS